MTRGARERERPHTLGVQHADDLRDHTAHRRADDVRALDAFGVEHLDRVLGHAQQVVRTGRHVGGAGAAVVGRNAAVPAAERAALQRPAPCVHAEPLDQQARATDRAGPTAWYAILTPSSWCHDRRGIVLLLARPDRYAASSLGGRHDARRRAPQPRCSSNDATASRTASAKRAAASGSPGSYGRSSVTSEPEAHAPRADRRAERTARRDRDRDDAARASSPASTAAAACPRRCATRSARAGRRRDARRATRSRGRAGCRRSRRAAGRSRRRTATFGAPMTRSRRPAARCTATPSAAGSKTPKPRFATSTAPPSAGTCSSPVTSTRTSVLTRSARTRSASCGSRPNGRTGSARRSRRRSAGRQRLRRRVDPVDARARDVAHAAARPRAEPLPVAAHAHPPRALSTASRIGTTFGPLEQLAQHLLRRAQLGEAERVDRAAAGRRYGRGAATRRRAARSPRPRPRRRGLPRPTTAAAPGPGPDRRAAPLATASPRPGPTMFSGPS